MIKTHGQFNLGLLVKSFTTYVNCQGCWREQHWCLITMYMYLRTLTAISLFSSSNLSSSRTWQPYFFRGITSHPFWILQCFILFSMFRTLFYIIQCWWKLCHWQLCTVWHHIPLAWWPGACKTASLAYYSSKWILVKSSSKWFTCIE